MQMKAQSNEDSNEKYGAKDAPFKEQSPTRPPHAIVKKALPTY